MPLMDESFHVLKCIFFPSAGLRQCVREGIYEPPFECESVSVDTTKLPYLKHKSNISVCRMPMKRQENRAAGEAAGMVGRESWNRERRMEDEGFRL